MVQYDASLGGIAALVAVMLFLTTTTVGLRVAARHKQRLSLGPDDFCAIISWVGVYVYGPLFWLMALTMNSFSSLECLLQHYIVSTSGPISNNPPTYYKQV